MCVHLCSIVHDCLYMCVCLCTYVYVDALYVCVWFRMFVCEFVCVGAFVYFLVVCV